MHFVAVGMVYAGLAGALVALVCLARPPRILALTSRARAVALFIASAALVFAGWSLPARERQVSARRTALDTFVPRYQFSERHARRVCAPPERIYRAIKTVTADEIALFRTLTWIRRLGQSHREDILAPGPHTPILDVATRGGFVMLADEPGEIVVGTIVLVPKTFRRTRPPTAEELRSLAMPGFAKAGMNFRIDEDTSGCSVVTTETRVFATSNDARRSFGAYWRSIYPGSAIIRRSWLRAIEQRAIARLGTTYERVLDPGTLDLGTSEQHPRSHLNAPQPARASDFHERGARDIGVGIAP